jgi:hypothetical protein
VIGLDRLHARKTGQRGETLHRDADGEAVVRILVALEDRAAETSDPVGDRALLVLELLAKRGPLGLRQLPALLPGIGLPLADGVASELQDDADRAVAGERSRLERAQIPDGSRVEMREGRRRCRLSLVGDRRLRTERHRGGHDKPE